jgi:hypothetical protein
VTLVFLTPAGWLLALAGALPLLAVVAGERRARRVRRELLLPPGGLWPAAGRAAAIALIALLAGAAAAQPVLVRWSHRATRAEAQAYVIIDTPRSMLAAPGPADRTRFDRARSLALQLRDELPDVPLGVASVTDRMVPHLFPTVDGDALARTVERSVAIEQPPPRDLAVQVTHLDAIGAAGRGNYFGPEARHRLLVVLTDGETVPVDAERLGGLETAGADVVVIRIGDASESIYDGAGRRDPGYRPMAGSAARVATLVAMAGGMAFGEDDAAAAVAAARRITQQGPVVDRRRERDRMPLATWAAAAACVLASGLAVRRVA